jgi:REP element-mobilizing transposase RayT
LPLRGRNPVARQPLAGYPLDTNRPGTIPHGTNLMPRPNRVILASHLVLHGYGHWLSNDPRGSGSASVRKDVLKELGDVHHGRKRVQPPREELRAFYGEAEPLLEHEPVWFNDAMRRMIADAIGRVARERGNTLWALSVCSNHAHAVVRTHRDRSEVIWQRFADASRNALRAAGLVTKNHPVWSHRPYKVFLYSVDDVSGRIQYVEDNPLKEGLPRQTWDCVVEYPQRKR